MLDAVIGLYAAILALILTTGGIDFGFLSLTGAAKPILVLLLLRITLAGACMRKLLTILYTMMRTNTTWLQSAEVPA